MLTQLIGALTGSGGMSYIVGIIAAMVTAFSLYFGGKKSGKAEAEIKHAHEKSAAAIQAAQETVSDVIHTSEVSKNVESEIFSAPAGVASDRLRNEWNIRGSETDSGSADEHSKG